MNPITVRTSAGPVRIGTELGNPAAPVNVVLGQGLMSVSLFLTLEQAAAIESALNTARGVAMHDAARTVCKNCPSAQQSCAYCKGLL